VNSRANYYTAHADRSYTIAARKSFVNEIEERLCKGSFRMMYVLSIPPTAAFCTEQSYFTSTEGSEGFWQSTHVSLSLVHSGFATPLNCSFECVWWVVKQSIGTSLHFEQESIKLEPAHDIAHASKSSEWPLLCPSSLLTVLISRFLVAIHTSIG